MDPLFRHIKFEVSVGYSTGERFLVNSWIYRSGA